MEWQRQGLLSEVEFQRAKDKILGEEPKYASHCMLACSAKASKKSMAGHRFLWVVGHMGARMQHAWRMQHTHSEHDNTSIVGGGAAGPVRP